MTTSGTTNFAPDNLEIVEEAFDLAGIEGRTGQDYQSAVRSINLIQQEWANEGINLWTLADGTLTLTAGEDTYSLPVDTIDILEHHIRTGSGTTQVDYRLKRIPVSRYSDLTDKNVLGRPSQIFVQRLVTPQIRLYPVPDTTYTLIYWRLRRIQDAGGGLNTLDMPMRFVPALITGLACKLALKNPDKVSETRLQRLDMEYAKQLEMAKEEDRDRSSFFVRPRGSR